ncbi:MAG: FeoA family protein [Bacillota bacterium]
MERALLPLDQLPIGRFGEVRALLADSVARRRMLDLGLIEHTRVEALRRSPSGDPVAYQFRGAVIALRSDEARQIMVELCGNNL